MPRARIELTNQKSGEQAVFLATFSDEEWGDLQDFVACTRRLVATRFVKTGMPSSLTIKYDRDAGTSFEASLPSDDDLSAFLHRFRPFVLDRERTHFHRIARLLGRELQHGFFQKQLKTLRYMFSAKVIEKQLQLRSGDVLLNSERNLKEWLNAYEYHTDRAKQETLAQLHQFFPLDASKVIFIAMLTKKAEAVTRLNQIVAKLLTKAVPNDDAMRPEA